MLSTSAFAETAALMGDPPRANMLVALMDGRALTPKELASAAGITPQTASGHLSRLAEAGLLTVERQGRHRYHRLASGAVAAMVESVMSVASDPDGGRPVRREAAVVGPRDQALRRARTCYDHLAGRLGVALTDTMAGRGHLDLSPNGRALTEAGARFLGDLGVDLGGATGQAAKRGGGRVFCRPCLDWSERRPHIAGSLGASFCRSCLQQGWVRRLDGTRAVAITPAGQLAFRQAFGLRIDP